MDNEATLQQLLHACEAAERDAMALARRTDSEPLCALLRESALQYGRTAGEIRAAWKGQADLHGAPARRGHRIDDGADPVALWESIEGETLTYFRDAYDTSLSPELADAVRRHLEAGIRRLEQLRQMHAIDA
jgi:hypothetical protein